MKIVGRINNSLVAISGLFLAVSVTFCTINALGRYLFNFYFPWADEFNIFLIVFLVFLTQPWLETRDDQLKIGVLDNMVKNGTVLRVIYVIRGIVTMAIFGVLVRYGVFVVENTYASKVVTYMLQIPRYTLYAATTAIFCWIILVWLAMIFLNKGAKLDQ
ncbi:MAG TPA: TRAP transporter small permease subunit [Paenibacillaceae bacterium]